MLCSARATEKIGDSRILGSGTSEPGGMAHLRESALRENAERSCVSWLIEGRGIQGG